MDHRSSIVVPEARVVPRHWALVARRSRLTRSRFTFQRSRFARVHLPATALLLLLTGCAETPEAPPEPPRIVFEETAHHFGTVEQGTTVAHDFPFVNAGGLDLTVDHLRSGCNCTATLVSVGAIRPGGTGSIRASCETPNLSGRQHCSITVYANDPNRQAMLLTLTGEVTADVVSEPAELYVGHVHRGERVQRELTVRTTTSRATIEAIEVEGTLFTLQRVDQGDGEAARRFRLVVDNDAPFGPFTQAIRIRTTGPRPPLRVPVLGEIDPDVTVSPARVEFGRTELNRVAVRHLLVRNHSARPVRITSAEWDPPLGQAETNPLDPGMRYRVRLTLNPNLPVGGLGSAVILRTDHPDQPTIRVPVSGEVGVPAAPAEPQP